MKICLTTVFLFLTLIGFTQTCPPVPPTQKYFVFDGVDDWVGNVPTATAIDQSFKDLEKIEFWFKIDEMHPTKNTEIYQLRMYFDPQPNNNILTVFHTQSELRVSFKKDDWVISGNFTKVVTTHDVADGDWHFLEITQLTNNTVNVILDGITYSTQISNDGSNYRMRFKGSTQQRLGGRSNGSTTFLKGGIDEMKMYDPSRLIYNWKFDDASTTSNVVDLGIYTRDDFFFKYGNLKSSINPIVKSLAASYDENGVFLSWNFEVNDEIAQYELHTAEVNVPGSDQILGTFPSTVANHLDGQIQENTEYSYSISALDCNGIPIESANDVIIPRSDFGNVLSFTQTGGAVEIDENFTNNNTQGTIEFRLKSYTQPPSGKSFSLLSRHDASGSNNGFNFIHTASNLFVQLKQAGVSVNLSDNENLLDGEWHHVALVYDWNGESQLIVDGELKATGSYDNLQVSNEPLRVGVSPDSFWEPYKGFVDELRIWSTQRTVTEVNANKNERLSGSTAGLEGVWHFDESTGLTAHDNGPENFDGVLRDNVSFYREPGFFTFSSSTNGFSETPGNNGAIQGSLTIEITGNRFNNAGSVVPDNLFEILNSVDLSPDPVNPMPVRLTDGLDPVMVANPDGRTASLSFNGEATLHEGTYSINEVIIKFEPEVFVDAYPIANIASASADVPYTLLDNVQPSIVQPIPDYVLMIDDDPFQINLDNHFTDPDFDQQLDYQVSSNNPFVSTSLSNATLTISRNETGEGFTDITATLLDNNGGEVSNEFRVEVKKYLQLISFTPVATIDLAFQQTTNLSASSDSGLPVMFELLDGDGSITGTTLQANTSGIFVVRAFQDGNDLIAPAEIIQTFAIEDSRKDDQTITFNDDLNSLAYGDETIALTANASSGLDVTYVTTGPISITDQVLTLNGAGDASITVSQDGNEDYNPASPVTIDFTIAKASLIAMANDQEIIFREELPVFTITYSGFIGTDDVTVLDALPVASIDPSASSSAGIHDISVMGGNDDNYQFDRLPGLLTINQASQQISFMAIEDVDLFTSSQISLDASADSGLPVSFEILEGDGVINGVDVLLVNNTGSFTIRANQSGNGNYLSATSILQSFLVFDSRKTDQTITFGSIENQLYGDEVSLGATASSNLPINYTLTAGVGVINSDVLTIEGIGSYEVTASQEGDDDFNPATTVVHQFEVDKAVLTVTADDITITEGELVPTLTFSYEGFKLADDVINIETEPEISTDATEQSPAGIYEIQLTGGADESYDFNLLNGTLTIEQIEEVLGVGTMEWSIYPNPVVHEIRIEGLEVRSIHILSLGGQLLKSQNGSIVVDVSNLEAGAYLLRIEGVIGNVTTHRFIKR